MFDPITMNGPKVHPKSDIYLQYINETRKSPIWGGHETKAFQKWEDLNKKIEEKHNPKIINQKEKREKIER